MAVAQLGDFVCETANNPGTSSSVTLLGAATGPFCTFATRFGSSATVDYVITDGTGQSESGTGAYASGTPNTLTRTTVLANTSGTTSRLNFTGSIYVFSFMPAAKAISRDETWQLVSTQSVTNVTSVVFALNSSLAQFKLLTRQARTVSSDALLGIQISKDGGSTYINTGYAWSAISVSLAATIGSNASGSDSVLPISPGLTSADGNGWNAKTHIVPGAGGSTPTVFTAGFGHVSGPDYLKWDGGGAYTAATGAADHISVTRPDGLGFSGIFTLLGMTA